MKAVARHKKVNIKGGGTKNAGVVTFTTFQIRSKRAKEIDKELQNASGMDPKKYKALVSELASICKVKKTVKHNLCVLTGRSVLAGILAGETTYTGIINYGALGTSSTAVADTDTTLVAEVKRKAIGTRTRVNDQVNLEIYFSKSDVSGTFNEFGLFIDGNTSANTGQMFNRLLTGGWTKTSSESLTASVQININHA